MPQISVIIPTYNRCNLIEKAIGSVINQTFSDWEIIVVDDHSTDDTRTLVELMKISNLKYFYNSANWGAAESRNIGIKNSSGKYIAFLDSDDEWLPQKLEKQYNLLKVSEDKIGVIYTNSYLKKNGDLIPFLPYKWIKNKKGDLFSQLLSNNFIATPSLMIKKEVFNLVGIFDAAFTVIEDYDLLLRIAKKYDFLYINEPLVICHASPDGLNNKSLDINANMLLKILEKNYKDYNDNPHSLSSTYFKIADYFFIEGKIKQAKEYYSKSLESYFNFNVFLLKNFISIPGITRANYILFKKILTKLNIILTGDGSLFPLITR